MPEKLLTEHGEGDDGVLGLIDPRCPSFLLFSNSRRLCFVSDLFHRPPRPLVLLCTCPGTPGACVADPFDSSPTAAAAHGRGRTSTGKGMQSQCTGYLVPTRRGRRSHGPRVTVLDYTARKHPRLRGFSLSARALQRSWPFPTDARLGRPARFAEEQARPRGATIAVPGGQLFSGQIDATSLRHRPWMVVSSLTIFASRPHAHVVAAG